MNKGKLVETTANIIIYGVLILISAITLYPLIYVLSMSVSSLDAIVRQQVVLYPIGFSLKSYSMILSNSNLWSSYYNTLWYTLVGTAINLFLTAITAYALSRKEFFARNFFMVFITITMFFNGGLIPTFILVNKLGLYNTRWAIVLPAALNTINVILTRVYFQTAIPQDLPEAAKIDGCNDIGILVRIMLPLSTPIISVVALYVAVGFWNSYFAALLYLPNAKLQPVTVLLQRILINNEASMLFNPGVTLNEKMSIFNYGMQLKYTIVIVTILPIMCVYPFLQKYFVKGVMLGALKG